MKYKLLYSASVNARTRSTAVSLAPGVYSPLDTTSNCCYSSMPLSHLFLSFMAASLSYSNSPNITHSSDTRATRWLVGVQAEAAAKIAQQGERRSASQTGTTKSLWSATLSLPN